jgi:pimeloyl-ACP methyl ester carboxylesterase
MNRHPITTRRRNSNFLFVGCIVILFCLPGCTPVESNLPDNYASVECPFSPPTGIEAECGILTVPENRANPQSQSISLMVATYKTGSRSPAPDPVVFLSGGPGESGIEAVRNILGAFQEILTQRDLIVVDQRGTGYSKPLLSCPEYRRVFYEGLADHSYFELEASRGQAFLECQARLEGEGIDLNAYNNMEIAHDVEDLRLAMGYDQWNLLGISYGTRTALTILREFPTGIRSAILDSTIPPEVEPYSGWIFSLDWSIGKVFDACAADLHCHQVYPELEYDFYMLIERLDIEPVIVQTTRPLSGERIEVRVDGDTMINLVFSMLYDINAIERLPVVIEETLAGSTLELGHELVYYLISPFTVNWGVYHSVMCSAESSFTSFEQVQVDIALVQPRLAEYGLNGTRQSLAICAAWNQPPQSEVENLPISSDVPALILGGEFDPVTPPVWGEHAAETLSHAMFYEFPGLSHAVFPSNERTGGCVNSLVMSFLINPSTQPDDECVAGLPQFEFAIP